MAPAHTSRTITERWDITYTHDTGAVTAEFFDQLAQGKIVGKHCPKCERVLVPPRSFCDRDYADTDKWVDVGLIGTIETFTVVFEKFTGLPDPPYCLAYVRLDGADTSILNFVTLKEAPPPDGVPDFVSIGQRVRVVFAPASQHTGRITDFWFEPV